LRVLVVDDLRAFHESVRRFAALLDCEVHFVTNLSAAVSEVTRWQPDAILLDLHLPSDRWQPAPHLQEKYERTQKSLAFCEQLTSHPRFKNVFVTFLSVEKQPQQIALAKQAGARGFISKGDFSIEKFERILKYAARNVRVESGDN